MPELTLLAEAGIAGICLGLIILLGLILRWVFRMFNNHMSHNTEAWIKNTEALTKLSERIDRDIDAQKETAETLRDLKKVIKK